MDPRLSLTGGGPSLLNENLDLLVDYWPFFSSSQMQLPNKEKKEVNKVFNFFFSRNHGTGRQEGVSYEILNV